MILGCVGLGWVHIFYGWVGSGCVTQLMVGLDPVVENGPTDNSAGPQTELMILFLPLLEYLIMLQHI